MPDHNERMVYLQTRMVQKLEEVRMELWKTKSVALVTMMGVVGILMLAAVTR